MSEEKYLEQKAIFTGAFLKFQKDSVRLEDGNIATREFVKANNASCVVALDKDNNIVLVKQFRYAQKKEFLELPAGRIEKDETPLEAAKRELLEETGFKSNDWQNLGEIVPTVYSTQIIHIFLAKNSSWTKKQNLDVGEFLEVFKIPFEEALKMIKDKEIKDSKTIIGILKAKFLTD